MSYKVQKITDSVELGEGPHWDDRTQALYFVNITQHTIHKYVPATGDHTQTKLNGPGGFIVPVEGKLNQFVLGVERKFLVLEWDGQNGSEAKVVRELFEVDQQTKNRINDGKADPKGRLYAGTMGHGESLGEFPPDAGFLYRLDGDKKITKLDSGIGISNGLAWDEKAKAMYYVSSLEKKIRRYDWDPQTGDISNMKHIFDFPKNGVDSGMPDGGTIDTDGNLWWAVFDGSGVFKINPNTGKILLKVDIPAKQVTSCTFGGPNLDILFVTTANFKISEEQKPPSGSVFMVTGLGVKGHPNVNFKL